jgi:hypothetical protein
MFLFRKEKPQFMQVVLGTVAFLCQVFSCHLLLEIYSLTLFVYSLSLPPHSVTSLKTLYEVQQNKERFLSLAICALMISLTLRQPVCICVSWWAIAWSYATPDNWTWVLSGAYLVCLAMMLKSRSVKILGLLFLLGGYLYDTMYSLIFLPLPLLSSTIITSEVPPVSAADVVAGK